MFVFSTAIGFLDLTLSSPRAKLHEGNYERKILPLSRVQILYRFPTHYLRGASRELLLTHALCWSLAPVREVQLMRCHSIAFYVQPHLDLS